MKYNKLIVVILLSITLYGCNEYSFKDTKGSTVVAVVGEHKLYLKDVVGLDCEGINYVDSLDIINNFTKTWMRNKVVEDYAVEAYDDMSKEVEKLVDDYRRSLYSDYLEKDFTEDITSTVLEEDVDKYYDENRSTFMLVEDMVKARVVRTSTDNTELRTLRRKFNSTRAEEYSDIKLLAERDGFFEKEMADKWYNFSEVLELLPFSRSKMEAMLKKDGVYEYKDVDDIYFVRIIDRRLKGTVAPRSVVRDIIKMKISSDRKKEYLESVKDSLYYVAIRRGTAKYNVL